MLNDGERLFSDTDRPARSRNAVEQRHVSVLYKPLRLEALIHNTSFPLPTMSSILPAQSTKLDDSSDEDDEEPSEDDLNSLEFRRDFRVSILLEGKDLRVRIRLPPVPTLSKEEASKFLLPEK